MHSKQSLIFVFGGLLLITASLIAAVVLVKQRQETRRGAQGPPTCGGLSGTHCNTTDCHDYECVAPEQWQDRGYCGPKCSAHPDCASRCGGGGGGGGGGGSGITEACPCGGWHEGWCDANACQDHPNDCCGAACMSGLVQCHTLGRCQRPDEFCPGGTECNPSQDCTFSCSGKPSQGRANCNQDCQANTRSLDICRGRLTNGNCQKCSSCNSNDPPGCDKPCDCCDPNKINDAHDPCWSSCYEKGPGYDYYRGKPPKVPFYGCRNTQSDVLIEGQHVWNCTWEDGRDWWECQPTPTPTNTPTPTPTNTPTPTPTNTPTPTPTNTPTPTPTSTPTPTPTYSGICQVIKMYDFNWVEITDYSQLRPEDKVYFVVAGVTNHPEGFLRGRIRVNGGPWRETSQRKKGGFYIQYTLPDYGDYQVEGQVYHPDLGWR